MPSSRRLALAATAVLLAGALPAQGFAKDAEPRAAAFQAVLDCRNIADNTARLACYDAAATSASQAEAKGDIVVIDRAQAQKAHRQAFGLPVPSLDFLTRALKAEDVNKLEGVVKSARMGADGRWTMLLEDGAQWRQISGDLLRDPKSGSKVVIHKGALGSFLMSVDGQAYIKVHRDI